MFKIIRYIASRIFTLAALVCILNAASAQGSIPRVPANLLNKERDPAISIDLADWIPLRAWFQQPEFSRRSVRQGW